VIGTATVASPVEGLDVPVEFGGREFPRGCAIAVESLVPWGQGVELQPLVDRLAAFPNVKASSIQLRRPLLRLPHSDAELIRERLQAQAGNRREHLNGYLAHDQPVLLQNSSRRVDLGIR
jgi:hypothetical protein